MDERNLFDRMSNSCLHESLYRKYLSHVLNEISDNAFYLRALLKPRVEVWHCNKSLGREALGNKVKKIMTKAAFEGHFINHSLRRGSATRLYQSGVLEQGIVETTGHPPSDGVRYINLHRQYLNEKQVKSCRKRVLRKLKRMLREKRKSCLRIMLNTMKKKKWD